MRIGVDLDDTLSNTRQEILNFYNNKYGANLKLEDIKSYNLWETWGGTRDEAIQKIEDFHKTPYFENIKPIDGAKEVLEKLKKNNELYIITARRNNIEKESKEWIKKYFPNIFSKIYFTNQFSSDEMTESKKQICDNLDIDIFIEDDINNALECAEPDRKVFLFDYPWNQSDKLPKGITRVHSWEEIGKILKNI